MFQNALVLSKRDSIIFLFFYNKKRDSIIDKFTKHCIFYPTIFIMLLKALRFPEVEYLFKFYICQKLLDNENLFSCNILTYMERTLI